MQVAEEFPGCGKSRRPASPTSSNWQRAYTLNYCVGDCTATAPTGECGQNREEAPSYATIDNLPFSITVSA